MQRDPAGVGVGQVRLAVRTLPQPAAQPTHVGTPGAFRDGQGGAHGLGRGAGVLQQPGAVLQALLGCPGRDLASRADQLDRAEQQQGRVVHRGRITGCASCLHDHRPPLRLGCVRPPARVQIGHVVGGPTGWHLVCGPPRRGRGLVAAGDLDQVQNGPQLRSVQPLRHQRQTQRLEHRCRLAGVRAGG